MNKTIRPILASLLLSLALAVPAAANTIVSYSASGVPTGPTTGLDPGGNAWRILQFGNDTVWGIPGLTGNGPWAWQGPDCLLALTVTAWEIGQSGDIPLTIDLGGGLNLFRNVSTNSNFLSSSTGNSITFTAPALADMIRTGQYVNSGVFVINPGGGSDNVRFDVTYELYDHQETPEPATYALVGVALGGIGLWRKRSERSQMESAVHVEDLAGGVVE